jgi:salicylate hydroxylase
LYEKTRRPHTERLLKGVLSNVGAAVITTDEALIEKMKSRPSMTWLSEHDVEGAFADVVQKEEPEHRRPAVYRENRIGRLRHFRNL